MEFTKQRVLVRHQRLGPRLARRHVATERLPARAEVLNFATVFRRKIERCFRKLLVADRNTKARAELAKLFFVEFFLLVRDVATFAAFAEAVALDRPGQNYGR